MVDPVTVAAVATTASTVLGFKGNQASARAARQTAEYNAQLAENEAVLLRRSKVQQEAGLRRQSDYFASTQRVAIAKSGIEASGSPMLALANTYFNTEEDAMRIRYAGDIEAMSKEAEAAMSRATGRARAAAFRTAAFQSLLQGASGVSGAYQQDSLLGLQKDYYKQKLD